MKQLYVLWFTNGKRAPPSLQMAENIAERAVYICEQALLPVYHHSHVRALVVFGETVR